MILSMQTTEEYIKLLTQYKNQNAERYGIRSISIFGSVARGEQHAGSDVDVVVDLNTPKVYYMAQLRMTSKNCYAYSLT